MPDLTELARAAAAAVRDSFPGETAVSLTVRLASGRRVVLPVAAATAGACPALSTPEAVPAEPFVLTAFQEAILAALEGQAMRTRTLGAAVGDVGRLYKPGGLRELQERDRVRLHPRMGHYRPDAPPPSIDPDEPV